MSGEKISLWIYMILLLTILTSGCTKKIQYSKEYEGIPIYPTTTLEKEYSMGEQHYEMYINNEFNGTIEDVENFYRTYTNKEKWTIKKNPVYDDIETEYIHFRAYTLTKDEKEVTLLINQSKEKEQSALTITMESSPLQEGKIKAKGKTAYWKVNGEYRLGKREERIEGELEYLGENPPERIEYHFVFYEMPNKNSTSARGIAQYPEYRVPTTSGNRSEELEDIVEAINKTAYIEVLWQEAGENKKERININTID